MLQNLKQKIINIQYLHSPFQYLHSPYYVFTDKHLWWKIAFKNLSLKVTKGHSSLYVYVIWH